MNINNDYVLITGATSGIGEALAEIFADKGYNLLLVARRKEKLEEIQSKLSANKNIIVLVHQVDLSASDAYAKIIDFVKDKNININILINNAGFGYFGNFTNATDKLYQEMINLNILTLTLLTKAIAEVMIRNNGGKILNIASKAGCLPEPYFSVYSATKSYIISFSQSIAGELKDDNIQVLVLCPGDVKTEFQKNSNLNDVRIQSFKSAEEIAKIAYATLSSDLKGQRVVFTDDIDETYRKNLGFVFNDVLVDRIAHLRKSELK